MRNRNLLNVMFLSLACTLIFSSCVSKKKFDQLFNDKESLDKMLTEQRQKVESLEGDVETLTDTKGKLESENAGLNTRISEIESKVASTEKELNMTKKGVDERDAKISSLTSAIKGAFSAYKAAGLTVTERNNRLYVNMPAPILYKSGSTRLRKEYKESVANLAALLQSNPNLNIMVEGHTDRKKMVNGARFQDNLSLSAARAMAVVRELVKNGASENQLSAVGRGDSMPASMEETSEALELNRRVEIMIVPNVGELHKMSNAGA